MGNCTRFNFKMSSEILCFLIILLLQAIWCVEYEECQGINEPDVVVASKKNCAKYIFCDGENSYEGACLAGNYFNENTGACDDLKNVKCHIKSNDVTIENDEQTTKSANDTKDNENVKNTDVEETQKIEESESKENTEADSIQPSNLKCPDLKGFNNIKHIANPESCVAFYTCYNGRAIPMLCDANMYFNEDSGKCEAQMPESCTSKYSVRLNCYKGLYDFVPHPHRCEYYFYCVNGYLMIMRCPHDFTWHYKRGTCVHKSKSNCYFEKSLISTLR